MNVMTNLENGDLIGTFLKSYLHTIHLEIAIDDSTTFDKTIKIGIIDMTIVITSVNTDLHINYTFLNTSKVLDTIVKLF